MAEQRKPEADQNEPVENRQSGHHLPPRPGDAPALDDTDRNTDRVITPPPPPQRAGGD